MTWTATIGEIYRQPDGSTNVEVELTNGTLNVRREIGLRSVEDLPNAQIILTAMLTDLEAKDIVSETVRTSFQGKKYGLDGSGNLIEIP